MKNKKVVYTIIGIVSIALIALAITYAYWQLTKTQQGVNEITAACLDISLVDAESGNTGVSLQDQYPLSDAEGAALKPYKFTVTNNCDTRVLYQIALESTGTSTSALKATSLKVMLDSKTSLLSSNETLTPTVSGAYASHKLGMGSLAATGETGASATHELRLWVDENAPVSENNKTYTGKISVTIGQGIESSASLKDTLLAAYGGEENILDSVTVTEGELEDLTLQYIDYCEEICDDDGECVEDPSDCVYDYVSYQFGNTYTIDKETRTINVDVVDDFWGSECYNDPTTCATYEYLVDPEDDSVYKIEAVPSPNDSDKIQARKLSVAIEELPDGMYKATDDYGDSYFYRGNITNNYVKFANYYWRIVRINGDGTIRMIYDGTEKYENGEARESYVDTVSYNDEYENKMYVGYMYGTESDPYGDDASTTLTSSTIKTTLDKWYTNNLKTEYEDYIADSVFCNDREEYSEDEDGNVSYKPSQRIGVDGSLPSLLCENKRDRFTVDDTVLGNGNLTNPIGLITADELLMSGYLYDSGTTNSYLDIQNGFWTSTPHGFYGIHAYMFHVYSDFLYGDGGDSANAEGYGARPVINLKSDVEFTIDEDGTYVITTN